MARLLSCTAGELALGFRTSPWKQGAANLMNDAPMEDETTSLSPLI